MTYFVIILVAVSVVAVVTVMLRLEVLRRRKVDAELLTAKKDLTVLRESAERDRARYEAQATSQGGLNKELLEMRSALINVLEDVEESKRQIERDFRRDAAIFAAIGDAVVAADMNRRIFLFNLAAAATTGVPPEKAIGAPFDSVIRFMHEDNSVLETGAGTRAFEGMAASLPPKLEALHADGRRIPVTGTATPFFDEQNRQQGVVLAFRDVTAEREVDRQKSSFVSIASHQLRTPLSAIRWYLDLLLAGDAGRLSKQAHEFLTDIYASAIRMNALVDDLLNVNRIETGRIVLKPAPTDLKEMVESIAKDFVGLLQKRKLTMEKKLADGLPRVTIDPSTVRQALTNLVSNAVNYTPEGGKITLTLSLSGRKLVVAVSDTGIGIPKAAQHRLFERFFRAENAISRETVGSGMGLFITKLLIETNHGTVRFDSVEGKGTTFYVAFPLPLAETKKT